MTIRVATVLSAREWEPGLVSHARETAALRIVLRAYQPSDIESRAEEIDVVVAGGEISWVTPRQISTWKRLGLGVIGIYPAGDTPSERLLSAGGANEVVPDSIDVAALVQAIRFVAPSADRVTVRSKGIITAVTGPKGAPGCTEIALAYALRRSEEVSTVLIDADLDAPALAVRLSLAPRPDVSDAADGVREHGTIEDDCLHRVERLSVITGSHRPGEEPVREAMMHGVVEAAAAQFDEVVIDVGAQMSVTKLVEDADCVLFVVEATAVGVVRAAQITSRWIGPQPDLILNHVHPKDRAGVIDAARRWTGLEPSAIVPEIKHVRRATARAKLPDKRLVRAVAGVGTQL